MAGALEVCIFLSKLHMKLLFESTNRPDEKFREDNNGSTYGTCQKLPFVCTRGVSDQLPAYYLTKSIKIRNFELTEKSEEAKDDCFLALIVAYVNRYPSFVYLLVYLKQ